MRLTTRSTFLLWLASLSHPPYTHAEVILRWADDFGLPATDAEFMEALESGLIPPPPCTD